MTTLAALVLLAAAPQGTIGPVKPPVGPIGPIKPVVRILNLVANAGFESGGLSPWETDGYVKYLDPAPDGWSAEEVGQHLSGYVDAYEGHSGMYAFNMNSDFPGYVLPGHGISANTYLRQALTTPTQGGSILGASVWVNAWNYLRVSIEYTSGDPTGGQALFGGTGWTKWNFRGYIDPNRTVKAIAFESHAPYFNDNMPTWIDDVNVSTSIWK